MNNEYLKVINDYKELKLINQCAIEKLENENMMIDMFIRDLSYFGRDSLSSVKDLIDKEMEKFS